MPLLRSLAASSPSGTIEGAAGVLRFWESDDPPVFLVAGQRRIGRAQLRQELDRARIFGEAHTDGWTYVVDTAEARFLSPLSLIDLMTIHRLPNVDAYVVVAPSRIVRLLARLVSPLVHSRVVRTLGEAEPLVGPPST